MKTRPFSLSFYVLSLTLLVLTLSYQGCGQFSPKLDGADLSSATKMREGKLGLTFSDSIGIRELGIENDAEDLLIGTPYRLVVASVAGRTPSGVSQWTVQSEPANACTLDGADGEESERNITCVQSSEVAIRIEYPYADGISTSEYVRILRRVRVPAELKPQGATLYAAQCAACHGILETSTMLHKSAEQIGNSLVNVTQMSSIPLLQQLTPTQIRSLAAALDPSLQQPTPTPTPEDGSALYAASCAACHGPVASSTKKDRTAAQIASAIQNLPAMQTPALMALSAAQMDAIAAALSTSGTPTPTPSPTPAPTDGAALYATHCSACHLPLASSQKRGASAAAITNAIQNIASMHTSSLMALTANEVNAISAALGGGSVAVAVSPGFTILESRFSLFLSASGTTAVDTSVRNLISRNISTQSDFIGGPCSPYERTCGGGFGKNELNLASPMNPSLSAVRRGYVTKMCEEVLSQNGAVTNILARRTLTPASPFNAVNTLTVFQLFVPGRTPGTTVTNALIAVGNRAATATGQSLEGWRYILYSVCSSAAADLL